MVKTDGNKKGGHFYGRSLASEDFSCYVLFNFLGFFLVCRANLYALFIKHPPIPCLQLW